MPLAALAETLHDQAPHVLCSRAVDPSRPISLPQPPPDRTAWTGHVVVAGAIGVGKTTVARALGRELQVEALLEMPNENPYLERFYSDPEQWAFKSQLWFCVTTIRQHDRIATLGAGVQDHSYYEARDVYAATQAARGQLTADDLALIRDACSVADRWLPPPRLVVYLTAPVDVLLERIGARGRPYEEAISAEFLNGLEARRDELFEGWQRSKILRVDTSMTDLREPNEAAKLADLVRSAVQV